MSLIPHHPIIIFQMLSIYSQLIITSFSTNNTSNIPLQTQYFTDHIVLISANIIKVGKVEKLVSLFRNQTLDLPKLIIFHKILKAARYVMPNRVILNYTNIELLVANIQKK